MRQMCGTGEVDYAIVLEARAQRQSSHCAVYRASMKVDCESRCSERRYSVGTDEIAMSR
jgi:hypothetical protein